MSPESRKDYLPGVAESKKRSEKPKTKEEELARAKEMGIESLTGKGGLKKFTAQSVEQKHAQKKLEEQEHEARLAAARQKIAGSAENDNGAWEEATSRAEFKAADIPEEDIDQAINKLG